MNRKFIIGWIVIFVAWFLGSFVVHGVLLNADYMRLGTLFRDALSSTSSCSRCRRRRS